MTDAPFRFKCSACDEWHEGVPTITASAPLYYYYIPEEQRAARCRLTEASCIVDDQDFFVLGNIEIPVEGTDDPLIWGVWVSLSERDFAEYMAHIDSPERPSFGPYFGWLSAVLKGYPDSEGLKTRVHLRAAAVRPFIELEPTDHPLAVEQRQGIDLDRLAELYGLYAHD